MTDAETQGGDEGVNPTKQVNLRGVSMFKDIQTFMVEFRFVFDNEAECGIKYPEHAITKPGFLGEIAHKVLTWCVTEGYVVNPLLLKDIKEQVAVRLYTASHRLGTSKKPPSEDPERALAVKELDDFLKGEATQP